jgi:GNAT superfamily N-acetyltransferase
MRTADPSGRLGPDVLELAILVRDDAQGQGLGTALARFAFDVAHGAGARAVTLTLASTNRRMAAIARGLGAQPWKVSGPASEVTIPCA